MKYKFLPHLLVIILAIFIRFAKLDKVPSSLYYDEIDLALQVKSILQTGKDYRNEFSPFYFRSYITDKTPLPILFSAIPSLLFNTPELQARAGTAIAGVIVVALAMVLSFQLTSSGAASLFTGLVFAFSPWLIQFSRMAFEAQYVLLLLFSYLTLFFQWLKTKKECYLYVSAIALGLSIYTYRTMSFFAPVILGLSTIYFFEEFIKIGLKKSLTWIFISLFFMLPFLYATTIGSKDQTRISQISIFSNPAIPIKIQRDRELVSGNFQNPTLGQKATLWSKVFYNKPLSYFEKFRNNFFGNFSPQFLFVSGDQNGRHSPKNTGELLYIDIIALLAGTYFFFNNIKSKKYSFMVVLLFFGAIPSNLTVNGADHASRLISFAGPLLLVVSLGYFYIFSLLQKVKLGRFLIAGCAAIWLFVFLQYTNNYFFHFPIENAREFGYGFKEAILKIQKLEKGYKYIELTETNDPPILYYLFWTNVKAKDIQNYGTDFGVDIIKGNYMDKVKPKSFPFVFCDPRGISYLRSDTLYMVSDKDLPMDFRSPDKDKVPQGLKIVDIIKYPNNEVAFYLITRDTENDKEVNPLKTEKCK